MNKLLRRNQSNIVLYKRVQYNPKPYQLIERNNYRTISRIKNTSKHIINKYHYDSYNLYNSYSPYSPYNPYNNIYREYRSYRSYNIVRKYMSIGVLHISIAFLYIFIIMVLNLFNISIDLELLGLNDVLIIGTFCLIYWPWFWIIFCYYLFRIMY